MTDRITIPPEALRAAARALHDASGTADCWDSMWDEMARAACLAMLGAWPGWEGSWTEDSTGLRRTIILPLSSAAFDELTELGIDEARRAAGAPAADDPEWKVVESAFPPTAKTEDGA